MVQAKQGTSLGAKRETIPSELQIQTFQFSGAVGISRLLMPNTMASKNGTLTHGFTVEGNVLCLALKTENLGMALKCRTWQGLVGS